MGGSYTEAEVDAVMEALRESMDPRVGFRAKEREVAFEDAFAAYTGARFAVAYNGAGTALDMVLRCLDLDEGDEVISGALNFVGTHVSVLGQGGRLVLAEVEPGTLNLDAADVARRRTTRTRAVLVTHMNGLPVDLDALTRAVSAPVDRFEGPPVLIVDAARACGATDSTGPAGASAWATVFSFQSKKLMTTLGEGGMVTTNDADLTERLRRLRSFGKNTGWGSNYKMTKLQAAAGLVQLRRLDAMNDRRIALARRRNQLLVGVPELTLPPERPGRGHLYYRYVLLVPADWAGARRDAVMRRLADEHGIGSVIADPPTYWTHPGIREHLGGRPSFPVAELTARRMFCPALHPLMSDDDNRRVARAIRESVQYVATTVRAR
ncbi:DegT/DnrJ/EryC1/StrS family aminotransferase [Streptomyces sp. NPDC059255]|uniref:DegT/DnrJ/EryC1/StrS family aminotransferase n=1 Tax=Streptomyces sp. NPDC059255 TaxID=3346793 RepID=UPI0036884617